MGESEGQALWKCMRVEEGEDLGLSYLM